jgi:hypothetical protein
MDAGEPPGGGVVAGGGDDPVPGLLLQQMQLGVALLRRPVDLAAAGVAELSAVAEAVVGVTRVEAARVDDVADAAVGRSRFLL